LLHAPNSTTLASVSHNLTFLRRVSSYLFFGLADIA